MQQIGNYDIVCKIAEGGMGTVYKGRHQKSGDIVAIKVIPPATAKNTILLRRFEQEFRAASLLDHPNVVRALEYSAGPPSPFLVMEFVDGVSLGHKIMKEGMIGEDEAVRLMAQVCQGLHRAHKQRMIHRDIKPDNIMITKEGVAKLTDLGLVKDVEGELNLTRTGRGLGTPHFMAPEQFRNAKNADIRCDIYSLGATLYMMVTREVPFGAKVGPLDCWMKKIRNEFVAPKELNPALSDRMDWAIRRAMHGEPNMRPNSCREFIEDLTGRSIRPPVPTTQAAAPEAPKQSQDVWYLVYKDENAETHTVKGTIEGIRKGLREGFLGNAENIRACRTKQGPFQPLRSYPEFRDLVVDAGQVVPVTVPPVGKAPPQGSWNPPPPSQSSYPNRPQQNGPKPSDPNVIDIGSSGLNNPLNPNGGVYPESNQYPVFNNDKPKGAFDWKLWLLVLMTAVCTALVAILVLPRLKG